MKIEIILHRISEDRNGNKAIHYSTKDEKGAGTVGCVVGLGGKIVVDVPHIHPRISTSSENPGPHEGA